MRRVLRLASHLAVDLLHEAGPVRPAVGGHHRRCTRVLDRWRTRLVEEVAVPPQLFDLVIRWQHDVVGRLQQMEATSAADPGDVRSIGISAREICKALEAALGLSVSGHQGE